MLTLACHSIIDEKPRPSFSAEDRAYLEEMADLAGAEILRAAQEQQDNKKAALKIKREAWKKSKLVRRVSEKSSLDTVEEVSTPPQSPVMISLEDGMKGLNASFEENRSESMGEWLTESGGSGTPDLSGERRGSLTESLPETVSDAGSQELGVTEVTPTFGGKKKERAGVHAGSHRLSPDMKSMLDLSTQLVGESLDLDFCCEFRRILHLSTFADPSPTVPRRRRHRAALIWLFASNHKREGTPRAYFRPR